MSDKPEDVLTTGFRVGELVVVTYDGPPRTLGAKMRLQMGKTKRVNPLREPKLIDNPGGPALGFCEGRGATFPYKSDREKIDGETVHFWLGDHPADPTLLADLCKVAMRCIEVVGFTYSTGTPDSFKTLELLRRK